MKLTLENRVNDFDFTWNLDTDHARLKKAGVDIWNGSLLPLFWLADRQGRRIAVKAQVALQPKVASSSGTLTLKFESFGAGELDYEFREQQLLFTRLAVTWETPEIPRIVGLYFGCAPMTREQRAAAPTLERPFWPNWRAWGFGVASAKTAPMQSFFRRWDFGHVNLPLGNFGPAMGTPYAAAFPRPTLGACMGGHAGCICFGAGSVPDAALTLQVRSSSGGLEWLYREDLWGAPAGSTREWTNPLWLSWDDVAWRAYRRYFRALAPAGGAAPKPAQHLRSFWCSWGDIRLSRYDLPASVDQAVKFGNELVIVDESWTSFPGSDEVHSGRLPNFDADIAYFRTHGIAVGLWQAIIWIGDYEKAGLTREDVLHTIDGDPVRANWGIDPHDPKKFAFCLDPSSSRALAYLRRRTEKFMKLYSPILLKLDFGYGVPGPDACAPRDPSLRGERMAWTLMKTIADAARSIDPNVTIMGYSLNPLWDRVQDLISMDDLGDSGNYEKAGHGHWSVWAALAGDRGTPVVTSSGYDFEPDEEILLNTAVVGVPASVFATRMPDGKPLPAELRLRRLALTRWHRRTTKWEPLWLDSSPGDFTAEPQPRNWGRRELLDGEWRLTSLALREPGERAENDPALHGLRWIGRWALIAQDAQGIFESASLAIIPFTLGQLTLPRAKKPSAVKLVRPNGVEPYRNWHWESGLFTLKVETTMPSLEAIGLLLE